MSSIPPPPPSILPHLPALRTTYPPRLRQNAWYLTTVSTLLATKQFPQLAELYAHLLMLPEFSPPEPRRLLIRRIREVLMKVWVVSGIVVVVCGLAELGKVEASLGIESQAGEDSGTRGRKEMEMGDLEGLRKKGEGFMEKVYKGNLEDIFAGWGSGREDFVWLDKSIIYGLFLSDFHTLDEVETELVVLPAILCQGIPGPSKWHLRGARRLGMSAEEVEGVQRVVEMVAKLAGCDTSVWPRVAEVEGEV